VGALARERSMFLRIAALGAGQVANLILTEPSDSPAGVTPETIRDYLSRAATPGEVFQALDLNGDGKVSLAEILTLGNPGTASNSVPFFGDFFVMMRKELGILPGENTLLPAVQLPPPGKFRLCGNGQSGEGNQAPCPIFPEPNSVNGKDDDHD
jgi:hypothetical protein